MFYILAEARSYAKYAFKPKGKLPINELSVWVKDKRIYMIWEYGGDRVCSLEDALKWNKEHNCRLHYEDSRQTPLYVDDPDGHTDTWLSFDEYGKALKYYKMETGEDISVDYLAVFEVMKVYEQANYDTRLVIWFDN
jgi:hypothetical protein